MTNMYPQERLSYTDIALKSRYVPYDIFPYSKQLSKWIVDYIKDLEEKYRKGNCSLAKALAIGEGLRHDFGIKCYKLEDPDRIIYLPHSSNLLLKHFIVEPRIVGFYGFMGSGKTISAWKLALDALNNIENATLYVLNDKEDGIGAVLSEDNERIVVLDNNKKGIPNTDTPKIIIYNELRKEHTWKRQHSNANLEVNIEAWRSRHTNTWIIRNVISYSGLEKGLKESNTINVFKFMTTPLRETTKDKITKGWKGLIDITQHLNVNEGLAIIPVIGKGDIIYIHECNPPQYLLDAAKRGKKLRKKAKEHFGDLGYWTGEKLLNLRESEELTYREMEERIGIDESTIRSRIKRYLRNT